MFVPRVGEKKEARPITEQYRRTHNCDQPHAVTLGNQTPVEVAAWAAATVSAKHDQ
jgi:hypothetical protein